MAMQQITSHSVFSYPDEIVVELRGRTADGEFTTLTYQFEPVDTDTSMVRPQESIAQAHEENVNEILLDAGYELT